MLFITSKVSYPKQTQQILTQLWKVVFECTSNMFLILYNTYEQKIKIQNVFLWMFVCFYNTCYGSIFEFFKCERMTNELERTSIDFVQKPKNTIYLISLTGLIVWGVVSFISVHDRQHFSVGFSCYFRFQNRRLLIRHVRTYIPT